ncbi:MAG: hypothetical protein CL790_04155 [Chloroflexi bacterium]|nr:hypothetical protein [Chloroflexota bacterium]
MSEPPQLGWPGRVAALVLVFLGGFVVMVLEIYGALFMRSEGFGGTHEVWISQIGIVMVALSMGYYLGGRLADRFQRASFLTWLLYPVGIFIFFTHEIGSPLMEVEWILDADEILGSSVVSTAVFLPPCFVLGMLAPYMIRLTAQQVSDLGQVAGRVYAASTVGSIAGVFGPVLLIPTHGEMNLPVVSNQQVFHIAGGLTMGLGVLCWVMDRWLVAAGGEQPDAEYVEQEEA